jgi:hypothetical protein
MPELSDGDDEPWQADPAMRLMGYPLDRLSDWTIAFASAGAGELPEGTTFVRERRVLVNVQPSWTPERTANALAHELGHVHDIVYFDAKTRDDYMRARGLSWLERNVTLKWPAYMCGEPRKAHRVACEDFAEVFALRWAPAVGFQSTVRPPPTSDQLVELERFLAPPPT